MKARVGRLHRTTTETDIRARLNLDGHGRYRISTGVRFLDHMLELFFQGFASSAGANLHLKVAYGRSRHHMVEAVFKALARALRYACSKDARLKRQLPSTKGLL